MENNMKHLLIIVICIVMSINIAYPAEVLIDIPPKPTNKEINSLMRSKELFAAKIMDYYTTAIVLRSQLENMNIDTDISVVSPTVNDLSFRDKKVLINYYRIILKLKDAISNAPDNPDKDMINQLRERIKKVHWKIDSLNTVVFEMSLQNQHIDFYKKNMDRIIERLNKLIVEIDSMHVAHIDDLLELRDAIIRYYEVGWNNNEPFAEVGLSGNMFLTNSDGSVDNKPSLGVEVSVNLYKLFGWWSGLYVWYEHINPLIKTKYIDYKTDANYHETIYEWKCNLSALGFSKKIPFFDKTDSYRDGIKLAAGYFWSSGTIYNYNGEFEYHGGRLDLEYYAGNFGLSMPVEAYMSISVYHSFSNDLVFHHGLPDYYGKYQGDINIGKTHLAAKLGLRLNLYKLPF